DTHFYYLTAYLAILLYITASYTTHTYTLSLHDALPIYIGVTFLSVSFLTASFLLETTSWFMTIIIVFVLGGLSFTKTDTIIIVSSSLKQQEAGAGMSLLNFTSFLSEGTG